MKIGILTFHRARNYGAFLQSYALKSYLLSIGVNAFIVDYWPKGHEEMYKLFSLRKILNRLFNPHCSYPLCNSLISNIRIF